jgi:uncharacterized OB-fold protein
MSEASRPLPVPTAESEPFWEACRRHEFVAQRCSTCSTWRHYPRAMCPDCHSTDFVWSKLSGRGVIHSYTVAHHAFHPYWKDRTPYVIATIQLEEDIRMVCDMLELPVDDVAIGLEVEVFFEAVSDEITLPRFRVRIEP